MLLSQTNQAAAKRPWTMTSASCRPMVVVVVSWLPSGGGCRRGAWSSCTPPSHAECMTSVMSGSSLHMGFAQQSGGFRDAIVVSSQGDVGIGVEQPAARLHVDGNVIVGGGIAIGPYTMRATRQGLQVCMQGGTGTCQMLLATDE